jgi:hypothetical protein
MKDLKIGLNAWADTLAIPLQELREAGSLAETHEALDLLRVAATEVEGRLRKEARDLEGCDVSIVRRNADGWSSLQPVGSEPGNWDQEPVTVARDAAG